MEKINLDNILPLVQRPGRYINHEWNSHRKKIKPEVSVCFCFPDMYEIGASNLGLEILYHIVNGRDDAGAERCYCPAFDMEALLREKKLPLFSLESAMPLKEFDIIGFSLQYELCATNVLNMIDLAGLPVLAKDRESLFPLIIGGGPLTANPEPMAAFFDAFVIGEGEEVIGEIVDVVKDAKKTQAGRQELLLKLAGLEGVYVPSLYNVSYKNDGTLESVLPAVAEAPAAVKKRIVNLETAYFPSNPIVPFIQTVHSRLNIEIARGCARQCRFCQASRYYAPWRVRSVPRILELLKNSLQATGFEEVAFSSLSCTDYKGLEKLLQEVNRIYGPERISISLPSLRCDQFSVKIAKNLGYNKRSSLTFAPEAGTERLRTVIGKYISDEDILKTLLLAWQSGWRLIKLYFMVGLPTETDIDIEAVRDLIRSARKQAPGLNFNITVSPFVPKPQTPFQWVAMQERSVMLDRMKRLANSLPASVKSHPIDGILLEALIARGDRKISAVIYKAWQNGCRFDQWKEHLKYDLWLDAVRSADINLDFYLKRERGRDEALPWDHIVFEKNREDFLLEYEKSMSAVQDQDETKVDIPVMPELLTAAGPVNRAPVTKLRLRFSRKGVVRFISHLEQIEFFRRAIRRSCLPVVYSSGFHPQPRISFGPAVSVGYESESEYIEVELANRMEPSEIMSRLAPQLPAGFELMKISRVPVFFPSLDSLLNLASYSINLPAAKEDVEKFLKQDEIIVEKRKGDKIQKINAKPLIRMIDTDGAHVKILLRFGPKKNVKPEKIIQLLCNLDESSVKLLSINRTGLYIEKNDGSVTEP